MPCVLLQPRSHRDGERGLQTAERVSPPQVDSDFPVVVHDDQRAQGAIFPFPGIPAIPRFLSASADLFRNVPTVRCMWNHDVTRVYDKRKMKS